MVDTIPDIAASINTVLRKEGLRTHEPEAYRPMVGWGLREAVRRAVCASLNKADGDQPIDDTLFADMAKAAHAAYAAAPADRSAVYPGIHKLVEELSGAGVPLSILSNKPDDLVQPIVKALFPEGLFTVVRGRLPDAPAKPDPASTVALLGGLGVTPSAAVFVGDSEIDMETALKAGCLPVGVAWGFRDALVVQQAGAAYMMDSVPALRVFLLERTKHDWTTHKGGTDDTQ